MKRMLASCLALLLALSSFGCGGQASTDKNVEWGRADAKEIDVNSKVAGRVVELLVKEGDEVKEGQVIARIDKRDLEAQKAQYEANIEAIQAQQVQAAAVTTMQSGTTTSALEQAQAALQQIEVSLDETEIKAPFDGVITEKYVEEGSMISNGTPLVAVQDPTDNWVDIKVPETQLSRFSLGDEITLVARDGETKVTGTITDISKKAEFATQRATSERGDATDIVSFNVKIQIDSPVLRPGMRFRLDGDA